MLYELTSTSRPVRIVTAGDGPTLIVNRDIVNSVLYGDQSIASQNVNSFGVIDALGSLEVDGTTDVYAIPLAGTPTVDVVSGAGNWTPSPALVALQISTLGLAKDTTVSQVSTTLGTPAQTSDITNVNNSLALGTNPNLQTINSTLGTPSQRADVQGLTVGGTPGGIPLLRDTLNLGNATNLSLPANATSTILNSVPVTSPSFEAVFSFVMPASTGTIPFAVITVVWQDSFTGLQVGRKAYVCPFGNGATNAVTVYLSGPVRGNQLTLQISNRDPSVVGTVTYAFNLTSHLYLVDHYLQPLYPTTAPNGQSQGAGNPSKGLLWESSPTIAASGTATRMTAASNRKCKLAVDIGGSAQGLNITITTPSTTPLYDEANVGDSLLRVNTPAGGGTLTEFQMPNGPVNVNMINQNTGATVTPKCSLIPMEY